MGERCKNTNSCQAYILTSPLGHVYTNACRDGLHCVKLYGDTSYDKIKWDTKVDFIRASSLLARNKHVIDLKKWLQTYFTNPLNCKGLPISFCCLDEYGKFNSDVWMTIYKDCPPGELMSYAELGIKSGYGAGASKVVGYAINKNPYMLIVGDHRIVKATGEIWCENDSQRNKLRRALTYYEISFTGETLDQALERVKDRNAKNKGSRKRAAAGSRKVKKEEPDDEVDNNEEEEEEEVKPAAGHKRNGAKSQAGQKKKRRRRVKKEETSDEDEED